MYAIVEHTNPCGIPTTLIGIYAVALVVGLMRLLLIGRHRGNIGRLIAGTENAIGSKKKTDPP